MCPFRAQWIVHIPYFDPSIPLIPHEICGSPIDRAERWAMGYHIRDPERPICGAVRLVGPPGTGKTLLAKAVAGEAPRRTRRFWSNSCDVLWGSQNGTGSSVRGSPIDYPDIILCTTKNGTPWIKSKIRMILVFFWSGGFGHSFMISQVLLQHGGMGGVGVGCVGKGVKKLMERSKGVLDMVIAGSGHRQCLFWGCSVTSVFEPEGALRSFHGATHGDGGRDWAVEHI